MPRVRSASAACSAAWSSPGSASRPARRSRACSPTSISTATSSSPTIPGPACNSSTVSRSRQSYPDSVSSTRYLILAEGFSSAPHCGKTAHGGLRYRRDDVVAVLDSTRAPGDTEAGVPVVQTLEEALPYGPNTALVGVATQGGRFPPAWTA